MIAVSPTGRPAPPSSPTSPPMRASRASGMSWGRATSESMAEAAKTSSAFECWAAEAHVEKITVDGEAVGMQAVASIVVGSMGEAGRPYSTAG